MIGISERVQATPEQWKTALEQLNCNLRVCCPGLIKSFNSTKQTATVQPLIREKVLMKKGMNGTVPIFNLEDVELPLLINVPVIVSQAGAFCITLPVEEGDECLVVFSDRCFDAWWQSSGVQNQLERRWHDLSDGFAIVGPSSVPLAIPNYSTNSLQVRTLDGTVVLEVKENQINITAPTVNITSTAGNTTIDGRPFLLHEHSGVQTGGGDTGPVV